MGPVMQIAWVAHPVGPDGPARVANLERAERWLRWLVQTHEGIAFSLPWMAYCRTLSEEHRQRGMRDNLAGLARCDAIVLVGGTLSEGMRVELDCARARGLVAVDYLHLGPEPPTGTAPLAQGTRP